MVFPCVLQYIIRHIARQRNLPQVAGIHRDGEIVLDRPAQLSRADIYIFINRRGKHSFLTELKL
jgi:hypothetical protein